MDLLATNATRKAPAVTGGQSVAYESGGQGQIESPKVEVKIEPQEIKLYLDRREIARIVVEEIAHEDKRKGKG
jgi:hypothetical protein